LQYKDILYLALVLLRVWGSGCTKKGQPQILAVGRSPIFGLVQDRHTVAELAQVVILRFGSIEYAGVRVHYVGSSVLTL
jgi:hypothetical protein